MARGTARGCAAECGVAQHVRENVCTSAHARADCTAHARADRWRGERVLVLRLLVRVRGRHLELQRTRHLHRRATHERTHMKGHTRKVTREEPRERSREGSHRKTTLCTRKVTSVT
eukprot:3940761-Rhodomonas_salina.1